MCESQNTVRTFKCDRVIGADILPDTFSVPEDFSLTVYWHESVKKFKDRVSSKPVYPVTLKILNNDFNLPENFDIVENNGPYITINLYSFANAAAAVWELKNNAAIIEPYDLKEYLRSMAEQFLRNCI